MGHGCKAGRYLDERLARLLGRVHWSFSSLTLSSLAVFFSLEKGVWELFNCTVSSLNEPVRVSVCVRERESTSLPGTYLTYTCLGAVFAFYFTLQAAFLSLCCDTQADTNKSYAQKNFVLFFLLIPCFITQCLR